MLRIDSDFGERSVVKPFTHAYSVAIPVEHDERHDEQVNVSRSDHG